MHTPLKRSHEKMGRTNCISIPLLMVTAIRWPVWRTSAGRDFEQFIYLCLGGGGLLITQLFILQKCDIKTSLPNICF